MANDITLVWGLDGWFGHGGRLDQVMAEGEKNQLHWTGFNKDATPGEVCAHIQECNPNATIAVPAESLVAYERFQWAKTNS